LKPVIFTNLYAEDALEGSCQQLYVMVANQLAWMTSYVFE
jgi:hypothetical protein